MSTNQHKMLRILVMVLLAVLFVQYEFGMWVNLANPPSLPAFSLLDNNAMSAALSSAGLAAQIHAILGFAIWLFTVAVCVLSLRSGLRSVQIFGSLLLLSMTLAGVGGTLFVASGFNNDVASQAMAANFILSYSFAFLEFYFLKGNPASR